MLLNDIIKQNRNEISKLKLPIVLGYDKKNQLQLADLTELQHILMTGETGSGKSTFEHTVISTFLQLLSAKDIQFFLVDMKRVELMSYKGLPNLYIEPLFDFEKIFSNLERLIKEKEKRLKQNDNNYPYMVVIIDTISDLMYHSNRFENIVGRLIPDAVKAKIHLIMSDSRGEAKVYSPFLKRYFPTRIAFQTCDAENAMVVLGSNGFGAEKLLGNGDMLFLPKGLNEPLHIQAPYISDNEILKLVKSF